MTATFFRVGIFTIIGLALIGALTVFVNDKPYWWKRCETASIKIEDATGLKAKSPVRSLGLEIGYLKSVELYETYVNLNICITAPVETLPTTRAYIRGEGFLGDKFLELKPVRYIGPSRKRQDDENIKQDQKSNILKQSMHAIFYFF
ncbi:MAG: MCE family protein, partial [Bdellovibrio sp.]|nr:MCE family protein [Bdellovibrio sp.]